MKNLSVKETEIVSGGWVWEFDVGIFRATGTSAELGDAYDWAVGQMSDFFTWWDPMNYYEGRC